MNQSWEKSRWVLLQEPRETAFEELKKKKLKPKYKGKVAKHQESDGRLQCKTRLKLVLRLR